MPSKRKPRKTNPAIFVFCEGKTEKSYIDMLRTNFRVPIQIITKDLGTAITQRLIDKHIANSGYPEIDKVFLFYDGDRQDIKNRLFDIENVALMLSCPCVELWFLLHFTAHNSPVSAEDVQRLLVKHFPHYRKGDLQNKMQQILLTSWKDAAARAKALPANENPSTSVYLLPEYLEAIKKR